MKTVHTEHVVITTTTLSLSTSPAHTANDVLFNTQEVAGAFVKAGGVAELVGLVLIDQDDQSQEMDIIFLSTDYDMGTENSGADLTDAEALTVLATLTILTTDYDDLGGVSVATLPRSSLGYVMRAAAGATSVFVAGVTRGTPTHTASGMTLVLSLAQRAG